MAILDLRLLELIETLVVARLDWLAFELMEGIRLGRLPEETEEALSAARKSIRSDRTPKARGEPQVRLTEPQPIPRDEQVKWAAAYVENRIEAVLDQLQVSIEALDSVVETTTEQQDSRDLPATTGKMTKGATLVLLDLEGDRRSSRDDAAGARSDVPALRAALAEWVMRARGSTMT